MNTKNIKIGLLALGAIAYGFGGLMFVAIFAFATLHSWPRALWEAFPALLFTVSAGVCTGLTFGRARQWLYTGLLALFLLGLIGTGLSIGINPDNVVWFHISAVAVYLSVEVAIIAELISLIWPQAPKPGMVRVTCFKCGKREWIPAREMPESMPKNFEQAEKSLVRGESTPGVLCDSCTEALKAFRASQKN